MSTWTRSPNYGTLIYVEVAPPCIVITQPIALALEEMVEEQA